jgi:hypothetical protein
MYNMIENETLFDYIDQHYVDISVLANTIIEDVYVTRNANTELDDTGNVQVDHPIKK